MVEKWGMDQQSSVVWCSSGLCTKKKTTDIGHGSLTLDWGLNSMGVWNDLFIYRTKNLKDSAMRI